MSQETSDLPHKGIAVPDEKQLTPTTDSSSKKDGEPDVGSCMPYIDRAKESKMMRKFDVSSHMKSEKTVLTYPIVLRSWYHGLDVYAGQPRSLKSRKRQHRGHAQRSWPCRKSIWHRNDALVCMRGLTHQLMPCQF